MSRLRDLGLQVGGLSPGSGNAISDVEGVHVGHCNVRAGSLRSGLTAVIPHPTDVGKRQLFVGRWALDAGDGMTGLGVAEDFGTLSSPILLSPAPVAGVAYEALIRHGLDRDPALSTNTGWPPLVVAVDEAAGNSPSALRGALDESAVKKALQVTGPEVVEGEVGIGSALSCFGFGAGVGTSSRLANVAGETVTVGVVAAASGGSQENLSIGGYPIGPLLKPRRPPSPPGTLVAVAATDAALIPLQLNRLSGRCAIGLARVGILDAATRECLVIGFSNVPVPEGDGGERALVPEADLYRLFRAVVEATEEAVLNALLAPTTPEEGRSRMPVEGWVGEVQRYQRDGPLY